MHSSFVLVRRMVRTRLPRRLVRWLGWSTAFWLNRMFRQHPTRSRASYKFWSERWSGLVFPGVWYVGLDDLTAFWLNRMFRQHPTRSTASYKYRYVCLDDLTAFWLNPGIFWNLQRIFGLIHYVLSAPEVCYLLDSVCDFPPLPDVLQIKVTILVVPLDILSQVIPPLGLVVCYLLDSVYGFPSVSDVLQSE